MTSAAVPPKLLRLAHPPCLSGQITSLERCIDFQMLPELRDRRRAIDLLRRLAFASALKRYIVS